MSVEKDIRYELLARLCPNNTGIHVLYMYINILPHVMYTHYYTVHSDIVSIVGNVMYTVYLLYSV